MSNGTQGLNSNFEKACEFILEHYTEIKSDLLAAEELCFELQIRAIVINDDPTYVRRKRILRDQLKLEKQSESQVVPDSSNLPVDEDNVCSEKLQEIEKLLEQGEVPQVRSRCKSKLLHLGHRLIILVRHTERTLESQILLKVLTLKISKLLVHYFYAPPSSNPDPTPDPDPSDLNSLFGQMDQNENNNNSLQSKLNPVPNETVVRLRLEDVEWIRDLQTRLVEVEKELAESKTNKGDSFTPNFDNFNSNTNDNFGPILFANRNKSNGNFNPNFDSNFNSNFDPNFNPNSNPNFNPNLNSNFNPNFNPNFNSNFNANFNPYSNSSNFPNWSKFNDFYNNSNLNRPIPPSPFNYNPFNNQSGPSYNNFGNYSHQANVPFAGHAHNPSRRTLPVSKWNIDKYDGEDHGMGINEFLNVVDTMAMSEHVSERELFDSAVHLFTGPALKWYMTMRSTNRLFNWQHLTWELKRAFMHPDLDTMIRMKIYGRKQQRNESFKDYYHDMERLFQTMNVPMTENEKLPILAQNMRVDYKKQINFVQIPNIDFLLAAGQRMDAINSSIANKVFGNEKAVNVVTETGAKPKNNNNNIQNSSQWQPSNPPHGPNFTQNRSVPNNSRTQNLPAQTNERRPQQSSVPPQESNTPRASTSCPFAPGTLEYRIVNHRPPPRNQCYNCGHFGHQMANCRCPKSVLCENCGFQGYPSNNCPYCLKNSITVDQNRRPLPQI